MLKATIKTLSNQDKDGLLAHGSFVMSTDCCGHPCLQDCALSVKGPMKLKEIRTKLNWTFLESEPLKQDKNGVRKFQGTSIHIRFPMSNG